MKSMLMFFSLSALIFAVPAQAQINLEQLEKEIVILNRVMKTALGDEDDHRYSHHLNHALGLDDMGSTYLQGQGVVMYLSLENNDFHEFEHFRFVIPEIGNIHIPDFNMVINGVDYDPDDPDEYNEEVREELEELVEEIAEQSIDVAEDVMESLGDGYFNNRDEMREVRKKYTEQTRELRERTRTLRRELRNGKGEISKEEQERLRKEIDALRAQVEQQTKEMTSRMEALRKEQLAEHGKRLNDFEGRLIDTLCEFGGSLRTLPDNEHLTIILRNADRTGERTRDRIYVFRKSDLIACRNGSITKDQLMKKGNIYAF